MRGCLHRTLTAFSSHRTTQLSLRSFSISAPDARGGLVRCWRQRFRSDLQYLVDSGVIDIPLTAWPIPSADVARALEGVKARIPHGGSARGDRPASSIGCRCVRARRIALHDHASAAADPIVLRTFEDTPREEGEIGGSAERRQRAIRGRLSAVTVSRPRR